MRMRAARFPSLAGLAALAGAAALAATPGAAVGSGALAHPSSCVALPVTHTLRKSLIATYRREAKLPQSVRVVFTERVKYGRCGATRWAFGLPAPANPQQLTEAEQISIQDHSPIFRRRSGRRWQELGIGPVCGKGALPRQMAHAWRLPCQ